MRDYKLVSEKPEAELFADLIRGSRDNRPTEGSAGLMRPEDAPQQERSFMDSFFEYMGMNSDEPDLVARTVANRTPSMTNFVEPEGELLNPWYSLVPITDFLFRDKTEEAIPTLPRMGAAPRMPTPAATAPEMPVVDPVSAEGSTRGETPVSQQQEEPVAEENDFLEKALDEVLANEGLYQNDVEDTGNYRPDGTRIGTMRGITPNALAAYRGIDANTLTADDMRAVTEEEARAIYRQDYYEQPRIDELPRAIQENVMDMYINSGPNAIDILQGLLGVEETGRIDAATLDALEDTTITNDQYADARIAYYSGLVERNPDRYSRYLNGWTNRANKYRD